VIRPLVDLFLCGGLSEAELWWSLAQNLCSTSVWSKCCDACSVLVWPSTINCTVGKISSVPCGYAALITGKSDPFLHIPSGVPTTCPPHWRLLNHAFIWLDISVCSDESARNNYSCYTTLTYVSLPM
jgi:hypothetical protein